MTRAQIKLAGLGLSLLLAFGAGYYLRDLQAKADENTRLRGQVVEAHQQVDREHQSDDATQATGEAVAVAVDRVQWRTRTILQEVPVYVTISADQSAVLPDGFTRLHNAAATGTAPIPYSTGQSPDAPSGITLSAAASTIVDNYGECRVWREQLIGWQEWYDTQRALWSGATLAGVGAGHVPPPGPR